MLLVIIYKVIYDIYIYIVQINGITNVLHKNVFNILSE